ncbi:NAD(P)-binding protein [Tilletiaria anomala UBC 951]|uniref:NAD(P)-binding protein n=1 Tax=Tilletiaria anomala (strain ATCC 24038 / CBS 436.72 / UBC 951) TaxID=1037660 RepID=A0A066W174_TILAU|nr:NAD(P)-binding protein [Tilletiaria anomala UBC 951]KDN44545.1 NAD(P)-binding protein [Tilletiaria anomala UBC 951]
MIASQSSRHMLRAVASRASIKAPAVARPSEAVAAAAAASASRRTFSSGTGVARNGRSNSGAVPNVDQRRITTSSMGRDAEKPTHASTDEHIVPYPDLHERDPDDIGHSTTGGKVGPHTKRTLASFSMDSKVCVVTGAARGIGNLIARTFVESGANSIAVLDLNAAEAQQAAKDIEAWFLEHGQVSEGEIDVQGYGCDVSNEDNVMRVMQDIKDRFGKIDVVVNSAGIVENFPATQYPTNKMKKLYDININGSYYVARESAKHMLADGTKGSIILVASMSAGVVNIPQPQAPYNASKAAVRHLAASFAVEWAKAGIRVNSLSPGYTLTSLTRTILESSPAGRELRETWENLTPMGRMADPEDLKGAVIYLASDASAFTTGTDLLVDGGYTAT